MLSNGIHVTAKRALIIQIFLFGKLGLPKVFWSRTIQDIFQLFPKKHLFLGLPNASIAALFPTELLRLDGVLDHYSDQ